MIHTYWIEGNKACDTLYWMCGHAQEKQTQPYHKGYDIYITSISMHVERNMAKDIMQQMIQKRNSWNNTSTWSPLLFLSPFMHGIFSFISIHIKTFYYFHQCL